MTIKIENLMDGYITHHLTLVELMHLLAMTDTGVGTDSPLGEFSAGLHPSGGPQIVQALRAKGIISVDEPPKVSGDLVQALKALGDPRWSIQLRMGNFKEVSAAAFYGRDDLSDRSLVGFKGAPESGFGISYFLSKEHVLALLEPYVQLSSLTVTAPFEFGLTYEEYLVLLAIVDVYRHAHLQSMLDRMTLDSWTLSAADIDSALYKGFTYPDTRWLVSVGQIIAPFAFSWGSKSAGIGIDGLIKRSVISPVAEKLLPAYYLSRELEIFCSMMIGLLGFSTVQIDEIQTNGKKGVFYANILRTPASIWVTGFKNLSSASPEVTIFSVDGSFLGHAIAEFFERSGGPEAKRPEGITARSWAETGKQAMVNCPYCKAQMGMDMKFCGYCGKPMPSREETKQPERARFCTNCGFAVKAGMQFCANCGALMKERRKPKPQGKPEPVTSACHVCGSTLVLGKKFCSKCGTPVIPKEN